MELRRVQFTTARLLCATVTIAVLFAVSFAIDQRPEYTLIVPPPPWFLLVTRWLTFVGLAGLVGATIGVVWKGEEGFVLGTSWGVIASIFFAPVVIYRIF